MTLWIVAAAVGVAVACIGYVPALRARRALGWAAAARALATTLVAAVALGAPVPGGARDAPVVALDASASWTRAADRRAFSAARDSAAGVAAAAGTHTAVVGESLRVAAVGAPERPPRDRASRVTAVVDSAATTGRALVLVTDGEPDDPETLTRAAAGSRVVVVRPDRGPDAAVVSVDAPADAAPGDTMTVTVTVAADAVGTSAGHVGVRLDDGPIVDRPVGALVGYGRASVSLRLSVPADAHTHAAVLEAVATVTGDREARNDTSSRAVAISAAPRAVIVSTAPDYDVGVALSVLRGALAVPVRAYYRVAPGAWRVAGTLAPARESDVRAAASDAAVLVLHGDTAALGNPRGLGRGALALVPTGGASDTTIDWYAGPSNSPGPFASITGLAWDSLPPVDVSAAGADAATVVSRLAQHWTAVVARPGRRGVGRAIVAGGTEAAGRRIAVVAAGGIWRWAFRGGVGAVAAPALWGAVFDWLAATPATAQEITPADAAVRSGAPVRWRGIPPADSVAQARLSRRGSRDTLTLVIRRDAETGEMQSDSPDPGVYDVRGGGVLVVNASAELLPRRPTVRSGPVGAAPLSAPPASPLAPGWPLALATALLCGEWVMRRRLGLR